MRAIEEEATTESRVVLPDTAKEKPQKATVLAVGGGEFDEHRGKRVPLDVAEGDEVMYSKYGGMQIKVDGEELLVLREADLVAVIAGDAPRHAEQTSARGGKDAADVAELRVGAADAIDQLRALAR